MIEFYRPEWDDYFMAMARIVATRSTCNRLRAGAVLVKDSRIISTGYNGSPPGLPHCDGEEGHLLEDGHCVRTIHGEHNAILQVAKISGSSTEGATMYMTYSPCIHCAKYIIAAGIKRVVIGRVYRNEKILGELKKAGIRVAVYQDNDKWNKKVRTLFEDEIEEKNAPTVKLTTEK
ncbi:MAG: dCMP deaminase [Parcubacteria group bacterium]|nr:dCMP deaminase [Parcubacteria group bacterium]